jgi:hypothetical protein
VRQELKQRARDREQGRAGRQGSLLNKARELLGRQGGDRVPE